MRTLSFEACAERRRQVVGFRQRGLTAETGLSRARVFNICRRYAQEAAAFGRVGSGVANRLVPVQAKKPGGCAVVAKGSCVLAEGFQYLSTHLGTESESFTRPPFACMLASRFRPNWR